MLSNPSTIEKILEDHKDFHIFIDELTFGLKGVNYDKLKTWSEKVAIEKHLWIVIGYGKDENFCEALLETYFYIPLMDLPLRNTKDIVELVQQMSKYNAIYPKYGNNPEIILQLKIPSNLTNTFKPILINAIHWRDGFEKALTIIEQEFSNQDQTIPAALFALGGTHMGHDIRKNSGHLFKCQCYDNDQTRSLIPQIMKTVSEKLKGLHPSAEFLHIMSSLWCHKNQLRSQINEVFREMKRPLPILYGFSKEDTDLAKSWITTSDSKKDCDLVTLSSLVHGFEHNIVVLFQCQDQQFFDANISMRATALLIIVNIPTEPLDNVCFGKCHQGSDHLKVNHKKHFFTFQICFLIHLFFLFTYLSFFAYSLFL